MEYTNEFTREQINELLAKTGHFALAGVPRDLARSLLAEMDKPKVWDGAPENAIIAQVHFYKAAKTYATPAATPEVYTRELPKSRAREIAEEARSQYERGAVGAGALDDVIESAILKALKEKKEGKE